MRETLKRLAKRDQKPVATKVVDLIEEALELEEDLMLSKIADDRLKNYKGPWLSHDEVWGKKKSTR